MDASAPVIASIVHEHAQETIALCLTRGVIVEAPGVRLHGLERHDERLAAHLDGLAVAGGYGWGVCEAMLGTPDVGEVFLVTVRAIESGNSDALARICALAEADPASRPGLISALGWVSSQHLQGKVTVLLASTNPFFREIGISTCVMHRVDPGAALDKAVADPDLHLRAQAMLAVGQCGRRDLLGTCLRGVADPDPACRFGAACSGVLLGDRQTAPQALQRFALEACPQRRQAFRLLLRIMDGGAVHHMLNRLAQDQADLRLLIEGAGVACDPRYVGWLISQMHAPKLARLAGEAFTFITGLDLGQAHLVFDREAPADFTSGPTDDPDDDNVAMDEDDGLPWPDPVKLQAWWEVNHGQFLPGVRYFLGAPPTVEHCRKVLREGYQRQRIAAAEYLCLLTPGTPLFPTSAPAWRQQRWLRQMR
jgi:uncharacterized protein (TIGR02270 family)